MSAVRIVFVLLALFGSPAGPVASAQEGVAVQVEAEIREIARRHAESDSSMQTSTVLEIFRENTAGIPPRRVAEIYEDEYLANKKDLPYEWAVIAALAVLVVIRDAVLDFLKKLGGRLLGAIENAFSGSRVFHGLALRRYRRALVTAHSKLKVSFRPDRPLDMRQVFVPLRMEGHARTDQVEVQAALGSYRRILVKGTPGAGKSMMLQRIALDYAEEVGHLGRRVVTVLVALHRLNKEGSKLFDAILDELDRRSFSGAEPFLKAALSSGDLLLLLDGLDEVSAEARPDVCREIEDLLAKHPRCGAVVTCRSAVYREELASSVDATLEIVEFDDHQIQRFLSSWEVDMPDGRSSAHLLQVLRDRPRIMALARNPLLLTIIAYLYTDQDFILPHSRTEFYEQSTNVLLRQWKDDRNKYEASDKRLVLQHLALYAQDRAGERREDRRSVPRHEVLAEVAKVLPPLNLVPERDARPMLTEIVERSGLLLEIDGGTKYQFAHLTLQEYFAAGELRSRQDDLLERFEGETGAWRETVKLWCGAPVECTAVVRAVHGIDPIAGFECLADASKVEPSLAGEIIEGFQARLGEPGNPGDADAIARAFGAVASSRSSRGRQVFDYLKSRIDDPDVSKDVRAAAAEAVSYSNLPEGATLLARHCDDQRVFSALVRMGDLAVPGLESAARDGVEAAVAGLRTVGTQQAATALTGLLWGDGDVAKVAAWELGQLIGRADEWALQPPAGQPTPNGFEWVWSPFAEGADNDATAVVARVAELVSQELREASPRTTKIDPRIAIPLCLDALKEADEWRYGEHAWDSRANSEALNAVIQKWADRLDLPGSLRDEPTPAFRELVRSAASVGDPAAQSDLVRSLAELASWPVQVTCALNMLTPQTGIDLIGRLLDETRPTRDDWINVLKPVEYSFERSGHLLGLFSAAALLTLFALGSSLMILLGSESTPKELTWFAWISAVYLVLWGGSMVAGRAWRDPENCFVGTVGGIASLFLGLFLPFVFIVEFFKGKESAALSLLLVVAVPFVCLAAAALLSWPMIVVAHVAIRAHGHVGLWLGLLIGVAVVALVAFIVQFCLWKDRLARNPLRDLIAPASTSTSTSRPDSYSPGLIGFVVSFLRRAFAEVGR